MTSWTSAALLLVAGGTGQQDATVTAAEPFTFDRGGVERQVDAQLRARRFRIENTDPAFPCSHWRAIALVRALPGDFAWRYVSSAEPGPDREFTLLGIPGTTTVVVVVCIGQPGYSLHGPRVWGEQKEPAELLHIRRRRTVRVSLDVASSHTRVRMVLSQHHDVAPWPECRPRPPDHAECVGVPYEATAIVLAEGEDGLRWGGAEPRPTMVQTVSSVGARWARLVYLVDAGSRVGDDLRVRTWLEKHGASAASGSRVRFTSDSSTRVYPLDSRSIWLAGRNNAEDRFLEVKGEGVATVRVSAERLRDTAPEQPFMVFLRPPVSVIGSIVGSDGQPAFGALVSVFELVPSVADDGQPPPEGVFVRRWIAETLCDHDGRFVLSGPPPGRYEFLVAHPSYGRASEERQLDGTPIRMQLRSTPRVKGRVSRDRLPLAGVPVRSVPDPSDFVEAVDPVAMLAVGAVTDQYGEFELSLPEQGSGTVVVGGGELPTARRHYADAESLPPLTDLGEIVLPRPLKLTVRVPGQGCELHAAGPLGALGLSHVRSTFDPFAQVYRFLLSESGFWWIEAECDGEVRALQPPVVQVDESSDGQVLDATLLPVDR